jgi:hypothetical protein
MYLTYWVGALIAVWVPISVMLQGSPKHRSVVAVGNFAVATMAALVLVVRLGVLGLPGNSPWTTNALDILLHLLLPVIAIALFLCTCTCKLSSTHIYIGVVLVLAFTSAWAGLNVATWQGGRSWVYGKSLAPSTKTGAFAIVFTLLLTIALVWGLAALKRKLHITETATCIVHKR